MCCRASGSGGSQDSTALVPAAAAAEGATAAEAGGGQEAAEPSSARPSSSRTLSSRSSSALVDLSRWEIDFGQLSLQRLLGEGSYGKASCLASVSVARRARPPGCAAPTRLPLDASTFPHPQLKAA